MTTFTSDPHADDIDLDLVDGELHDIGTIEEVEHNGLSHGAEPTVTITVDDPSDTDVADGAALIPFVPKPSPILPLLSRLASGRYRGRRGGFELELRVDIDGARTVNRVSGDYYTIAGSTTSHFGSWVVNAPTVIRTATAFIVDGVATTTWGTTFNRMHLTIPRRTIFQPRGDATLTWRNAAGATGATYVCPWEARLFRTVLWEQDSVVGAVPFTSYNTGSLPQPAGSPARTLSVPAAFAEAGIEVVAAGTPNVITNALAGADARWDEAELHAAMVANFSLFANVPQWRVYTLVASSFAQDGVRGIMYDASDAHQRQGMAVFHNAIQGTDAASQRAQLRTYVHELGHCFNLLHSWQKNLATPPAPLGPNGGLGDLSWMNYTWRYQPLPPAAGGDAAYWAAFPFQFTTNELVHLRHGFRNNVIMGGAGFGTGAAEIDPAIFAERTVDRSNLCLELRASPSYHLGEPVVVELKLASTQRGEQRTHGSIHPRDGLVQIAIERPSGQVVAYRPLMPRCWDHDDVVVLSDEHQARYDSAYIGYGQDGFTFEQPGTYRLRALYVAEDGSRVLSPVLRIRVRSPLTAADDQVAELLLGDGQGELLYLLGSDAPSLAGANEAMEELVDRHAKHPLAVFGHLVKGINAERDFKHLTGAKDIATRDARPAEAKEELGHVVAASTGAGGVDNITLNMVMRRVARAEVKAGDADQADATLDRMVGVFEKKGLKPAVLETIAADAAQEKTELRAELGDG